MIPRAFVNSAVLTIASVTIMVVISAMVGYVLQRRPSRLNPIINFFVLAGLIVPPAIVPTIWVLQDLGLFKTLPGMILVEVTFGISFCILLFRAFVGTIPRELDEAAVIDGAGAAPPLLHRGAAAAASGDDHRHRRAGGRGLQ